MTKDTFIGYVSRPSQFSLQDRLDIHNEKMTYPYCSVLQVLDLLSEKATSENWNDMAIAKVAAHVSNTGLLYRLLDKVVKTEDDGSHETQHLKEKIEVAKNREKGYTASGKIDVLEEINSLQEISFKTAPKSVILETFLNSDTKKMADNPSQKELSIDELGKKSNSENNVLETETLAVIFAKQGKIEKSIEIYEKLIAKNPEKSSIFASRISELKSKLNLKANE